MGIKYLGRDLLLMNLNETTQQAIGAMKSIGLKQPIYHYELGSLHFETSFHFDEEWQNFSHTPLAVFWNADLCGPYTMLHNLN